MDLMSSQALPMAGYLWGGSMKHWLMDIGNWPWRRVGSLQCLELYGNGILGSFHPKKHGVREKIGRKLLVCSVTPVASGRGMISWQKFLKKQDTCDRNDPRLNPTTNLRDPRGSCREPMARLREGSMDSPGTQSGMKMLLLGGLHMARKAGPQFRLRILWKPHPPKSF